MTLQSGEIGIFHFKITDGHRDVIFNLVWLAFVFSLILFYVQFCTEALTFRNKNHPFRSRLNKSHENISLGAADLSDDEIRKINSEIESYYSTFDNLRIFGNIRAALLFLTPAILLFIILGVMSYRALAP